MALKEYKPKSAGRRGMTAVDFSMLTKIKPYKPLVRGKKEKAGRDARGKISVRHRGGGAKKLLRLVDFKHDKWEIPARVETIEYDPNRSAFITLVFYKDGEKRYHLAWEGIKVGQEIIVSSHAPIKPGNRTLLSRIPVGTFIYNIELKKGAGGQLVRSAGNSAVMMGVDRGFAQIKFPSGEVRLIPEDNSATIGQISNPEHGAVRLAKAGRMRYLGVRPRVRGKAMNPVDHPHGGGEGHMPIGMKHPKTPWGKPALGVRTRRKGKASDKYIIKRRK